MSTQRYDIGFPIVVEGHKLKIGWVKVDPSDGIWHKEDRLAVWLELDEAVGNTLAFAVYLPVKKYVKNEFIFLVQHEAQQAFERFIREAKEKRIKAEQKEVREKALDTYAQEIQAVLQ